MTPIPVMIEALKQFLCQSAEMLCQLIVLNMKKFISLGFSCQSRLSIDAVTADHRALPYDWCFTTKDFILKSLTNLDGAGFWPSVDALELYEMPVEKNQGPGTDGIWFWHDFPREGNALLPDWRNHHAFAAKYPHLWDRFLRLIRDPTQEKVFVLSNSQYNLDQLASGPDDFAAKFGLDSAFISALDQALLSAGACNYQFIVLCRRIEDFFDLILNSKLPHIDPRLVGALLLPYHPIVAHSLLDNDAAISSLDDIIGTYDNGAQIISAPMNTLAVINGHGQAWGAVRSFSDGMIMSFADGLNQVFTAIQDGRDLYLSNKARWRKISD